MAFNLDYDDADCPVEELPGELLIPPLANDNARGWDGDNPGERVYFEQLPRKGREHRPPTDLERLESKAARQEWDELNAPPATLSNQPIFDGVQDFRGMLSVIVKDPLIHREQRLVIRMLSAIRGAIGSIRKHLWEVMQTREIPKNVVKTTDRFGFQDALKRVLLNLIDQGNVKLKGLRNLPPKKHRGPEIIKYIDDVDNTAERHNSLLLAIAAAAKKLKLRALHLMAVKNRGTGRAFELDEIPDDPEEFLSSCTEAWAEEDASEGCSVAA